MPFRVLLQRLRPLLIGLALIAVCAETVHAETVTLQWDVNALEPATGYIVGYRVLSDSARDTVDVGDDTFWSVDLAPGVYAFAVRAYNVDGVSGPYSAEVLVTIGDGLPHPELMIDRPGPGSVNSPDLFLAGWAIDAGATTGTGVDQIHVYAFPNPGSNEAPVFLGLASYGALRPDVAAARGSQFMASGYAMPIVGLKPGNYTIAVYAHSTVTNSFNIARGVDIRVYSPSDPPNLTAGIVAVELPKTGQTLTSWVSIGGWAIDRRSLTGAGIDVVQVWAYPSPGSGMTPLFLGNAQTGVSRKDVGAMFGSRFNNSGWYMDVAGMADGTYDIVILARSTVSHGFDVARVVRVVVRPSVLINIDTPTFNQSVASVFTISGWSVDRRSRFNAGVDVLHLWAYPNPGSGQSPVFVGVVSPTTLRPDVASVLGSNFNRSGWNMTVSTLPAGTYDIVVFGHSAFSNSFENAKVIRVKVQ